jgi:hypothetical protein
MVISPCFYNGLWVFDDPEADLVREPFVMGAPEILEAMAMSLGEPVYVLRLNGDPDL